jgi:hypothetical protein
LVRGLFSSLDIGSYIPPTCGLLSTFLGPFRGSQNAPKQYKNFFLVVLDYFFYKNRPDDLVRGLFSTLDIGTYILSTFGPLCTFLGPFEDAQMPQNAYKNYFLIVLDYFSYKNGPNDLVRNLF